MDPQLGVVQATILWKEFLSSAGSWSSSPATTTRPWQSSSATLTHTLRNPCTPSMRACHLGERSSYCCDGSFDSPRRGHARLSWDELGNHARTKPVLPGYH